MAQRRLSRRPPRPPSIFREVSRILELARQTLKEEQERILRLKERIVELRRFEEAHLRDRETIEALRADRDMWRRQAVAMSNFLLAAEPR